MSPRPPPSRLSSTSTRLSRVSRRTWAIRGIGVSCCIVRVMVMRLPVAMAVALCAVLPLIAPEVWGGFRLGTADPILSALSVFEQPLSVRTPGGPWAVGVALAWFALAYWRRKFALWEAALVLIGGAAALAR